MKKTVDSKAARGGPDQGHPPIDPFDLPIHPLARAFRDMTRDEQDRLTEDIRRHGQTDPIVIHDGMVLDGRHRLLTCRELGRVPRIVDFRDLGYDGSPLDYVLSRNDVRRHSSESQRAMEAARLATLPRGRRGKNAPRGGISQKKAAERMGVGLRSVSRAARLLKGGDADAIAAVDAGLATLTPLVEAERAAGAEESTPPARRPRPKSGTARRGRAGHRDEPGVVAAGREGRGPEADDLAALRRRAEGLPLYSRLADPSRFVQAAIFYWKLQELIDRLGGDREEWFRIWWSQCWGSGDPIDRALLEVPPERWTLCSSCRGRQYKRGGTPCIQCLGLGYSTGLINWSELPGRPAGLAPGVTNDPPSLLSIRSSPTPPTSRSDRP